MTSQTRLQPRADEDPNLFHQVNRTISNLFLRKNPKMLPFKRTFEPEKRQLQELNCRLAQYLSRSKQLEQENVNLIREISELRQAKGAQWEPKYKAEMRELRRTVEQLSLEKSQAEMEREKIWRELQTVQSLCKEQTGVCRDISGDLRGCEQELNDAHKVNTDLQQRLFQLESECKRLEDAHRQEIEHLRRQVMAPTVLTQSYRGPRQAATVEDVQEFAFGLSEGWVQTFDMYQQKVEEMERAIKEDQARMNDLQREKMVYAAELEKLRAAADKQGQVQMRLEEELMHMQEKFRRDCGEYQMIIDELEGERNMMADTIEKKMLEHQQLLQIKMDLGLELAAYRALLEGERANLQETHRRTNRQQRERIIEIKMPSQPYTPRATTTTSSLRQHTDVRYTPAAPTYRRSPVPTSGSVSPSRVIPISVARHQSPAARRDMISFTKARAAESSTTSTTKDKQPGTGEKVVQVKPVSKVNSQTPSSKILTASTRNVSEARESVKAFDANLTNGRSGQPSDKKILDTVSVEEIIEKVIKPAGLDVKATGDSKVRYHVEETQQEDGTTKTRIVLESKVEEELDVTKDSDLDELFHQGVKKVSLEDIKDTATASMIKNLLGGMKGGEDLANKSINVEIIEEPVETQSDDEEIEIKKVQSSFQKPTSSYFQIEELENGPNKATNETEQWKAGLGQVDEVSRESDSYSQDKEPREYFVSTPDDFSEPEEGCGITSYGHYGIVDDLSDERYYQDERLPPMATPEASDEYKYLTSDRPLLKEGFPECIIEEEVRVSPIVQESFLEFLREDSLEPKEQLKGALEKLQESVSGPLKEELAYLSKISRESPDKVAVQVRKVSESSDDGTMTIVAELNVSQTLEESGLLDESGELSEDQIMAALRGSGLEKAFQGGAGAGYSIKVSTEGDDDGFGESEIMEKYMKGGLSEGSYSYKMKVEEGSDEGTAEQGLTSHIVEKPVKIKEQRIVYLESDD